MDWSPLGWVLDAARFAWGLQLGLILKVFGLGLAWTLVIVCGILWLRSPEAPSLDDQEPRGGGRR